MKRNTDHITIILLLLALSSLLSACSYSRRFSNSYYKENDSLFQSIHQRFVQLHRQRPFSLAVEDKNFQEIGLEIITDTIKYVYHFHMDEPRLIDTLSKYRFDTKGMSALINDMLQLHCTWITNLDYYETRQRKFLVFISVRHKKLKSFPRSEKYFTLAFFDQPQPYDNHGRLIDKQDGKSLHRINAGLFRRIDDKICYSLSANFR